MAVDQSLVNELLSRKKKRPTKAEEVRQYREEILELRKMGLSLSDICAYLGKKYGLSVSPETLKRAVPELVNRVEIVKRYLSKMTLQELVEVNRYLKELYDRKRQEEGQSGSV